MRSAKLIPFDRELAQFVSQVLKIEAKIKQRPNRHIAADPGKTVKSTTSYS
jgi:hypothetical protein